MFSLFSIETKPHTDTADMVAMSMLSLPSSRTEASGGGGGGMGSLSMMEEEEETDLSDTPQRSSHLALPPTNASSASARAGVSANVGVVPYVELLLHFCFDDDYLQGSVKAQSILVESQCGDDAGCKVIMERRANSPHLWQWKDVEQLCIQLQVS